VLYGLFELDVCVIKILSVAFWFFLVPGQKSQLTIFLNTCDLVTILLVPIQFFFIKYLKTMNMINKCIMFTLLITD